MREQTLETLQKVKVLSEAGIPMSSLVKKFPLFVNSVSEVREYLDLSWKNDILDVFVSAKIALNLGEDLKTFEEIGFVVSTLLNNQRKTNLGLALGKSMDDLSSLGLLAVANADPEVVNSYTRENHLSMDLRKVFIGTVFASAPLDCLKNTYHQVARTTKVFEFGKEIQNFCNIYHRFFIIIHFTPLSLFEYETNFLLFIRDTANFAKFLKESGSELIKSSINCKEVVMEEDPTSKFGLDRFRIILNNGNSLIYKSLYSAGSEDIAFCVSSEIFDSLLTEFTYIQADEKERVTATALELIKICDSAKYSSPRLTGLKMKILS